MTAAATLSAAAIELDQVCIRYARAVTDTIHNLSIAFAHDGSSVAVAGPSGSGKSTLLSVIGGLQAATSGAVIARSTTGAPCKPLDIVSWVFQTTNALPRRSVLDNVAVGAHVTLPQADARVHSVACLDRVGLADHLDKPARLLSGGELQRLAVARALVSGLPFMVLDEPTGQLDAATSNLVLDVLFRQRDINKVIATHDPNVMERCDVVYTVDANGVNRR